MTPTISVLLPTFNDSLYLHDAIDSIMHQSLEDYELLVIDDSSTDNTAQIISGFQDPRIKVIQNEKNLGLAASLNKGLALAQGKYIARMDGDDISFPDRFERQIDFLNEHPDVFILGCNTIRIDADGNFIDKSDYPNSDALIRYSLFFRNAIAHPTVMMRSELFNKHNYSYNLFDSGQDFDLWTRIPNEHKFWNLPDFLYYHRRHSKSITSTKDTKSLEKPFESRQKYIERITGKSLTLQQVAMIKTPQDLDNINDAKKVLDALVKFTKTALRWCSMNNDKKFIKRETSNLILKVWGHQNYHLMLCPYLFTAIKFNPGLLTEKIRNFGRSTSKKI